MKNSYAMFFVLAMLTVSMISCTKGDTGPAGEDGNANVYGSNTITLNSGDWVLNGSYYYADLFAADISQDIADRGLVMVYELAAPYWNALPYTWGISSVSFDFGLNVVHLYYQNTDGSQTANPGIRTFRIVSISASAARLNSDLNWKDFAEVKKRFNFQD